MPVERFRPPFRGEPDLLPVLLFPNQGQGFGFSLTTAGPNGTLPEGYHRTYNGRVYKGRLFLPSYAPAIEFSRPTQNPAGGLNGFVVSWYKPLVATPFLLFTTTHNTGTVVWRLEGETLYQELSISGKMGSATIHDDGSGVAALYAGAESGGMRKRTQSGTWSAITGVPAQHVISVGGNLWRSINDYQVSKCPMGSSPENIANWSDPIRVGSVGSTIRSLGNVGTALVVMKEDGIFVYNENRDRFENVYPVPLGLNNFLYTIPDGEGGMLTVLQDGSIVRVYQFGAIRTFNPSRDKMAGVETPKGQMVSVATVGDKVFGLQTRGAYLQQPPGMVVFRTATDITSTVTDQDWNTVADLGGMTTAEYLLIGADLPPLVAGFVLINPNTTACTATVEVSTGQDTWQSVSFFDSTATRNSNGTVLASFGKVVGQMAIQPQDIPWSKATYNGQTKYWMRIKFSATLSAGTGIAEAWVALRIRGNGLTSDWEATGMLSKVLLGTRTGEGIVWDDILTIPDVAPGHKIAWCGVSVDSSPAGSLAVITEDKLRLYPLPPLWEPANYPHMPIAGTAVLVPSAVLLDGTYELRYAEVWAANMEQGIDRIRFVYRWDDAQEWSAPLEGRNNYVLFEADRRQNYGSVLHTAFSLEPGSVLHGPPPAILRIIAWVKPVTVQPPARPPKGGN